MDILIALFGPSLVFWFLLALPRPGKPFLIALGLCIFIAIIIGLDAFQPSGGGPDNWYSGVPFLGFVLGLVLALGPLVAQIYRYNRHRKNLPTNYIAALILCAILSFMIVGALLQV